jgi:hypothetical protein
MSHGDELTWHQNDVNIRLKALSYIYIYLSSLYKLSVRRNYYMTNKKGNNFTSQKTKLQPNIDFPFTIKCIYIFNKQLVFVRGINTKLTDTSWIPILSCPVKMTGS